MKNTSSSFIVVGIFLWIIITIVVGTVLLVVGTTLGYLFFQIGSILGSWYPT